MPVPQGARVAEIDPADRRVLLSAAYRMLGTTADAEDAVQEAYVRWLRLDPVERDGIRSPGAWLMRATARICLDVLGSARVRRERYVGEWLPEPVPGGRWPVGDHSDPVEVAARTESVSTALLLLLETLTPAERVVLVLHDAFAMPYAEIATVVDRTPAAASSRRRGAACAVPTGSRGSSSASPRSIRPRRMSPSCTGTATASSCVSRAASTRSSRSRPTASGSRTSGSSAIPRSSVSGDGPSAGDPPGAGRIGRHPPSSGRSPALSPGRIAETHSSPQPRHARKDLP